MIGRSRQFVTGILWEFEDFFAQLDFSFLQRKTRKLRERINRFN